MENAAGTAKAESRLSGIGLSCSRCCQQCHRCDGNANDANDLFGPSSFSIAERSVFWADVMRGPVNRVAVDHSVIKFARSIVALIIRLNQFAAQTLFQCLETIVAEHRHSPSSSKRYCDPTQNRGRARISSQLFPLKETPETRTAFLV